MSAGEEFKGLCIVALICLSVGFFAMWEKNDELGAENHSLRLRALSSYGEGYQDGLDGVGADGLNQFHEDCTEEHLDRIFNEGYRRDSPCGSFDILRAVGYFDALLEEGVAPR